MARAYNDGKPRLSAGERTPLYIKWQTQKFNAARRGIEFNLTYEEWLSIWQESGHIDQMGKRAGQYCMARDGDMDGYTVGNVSIVKVETNNSAPPTLEARKRISDATKGKQKSEEHKARISAATKGRVFSEEARRRMSESAKHRRK